MQAYKDILDRLSNQQIVLQSDQRFSSILSKRPFNDPLESSSRSQKSEALPECSIEPNKRFVLLAARLKVATQLLNGLLHTDLGYYHGVARRLD